MEEPPKPHKQKLGPEPQAGPQQLWEWPQLGSEASPSRKTGTQQTPREGGGFPKLADTVSALLNKEGGSLEGDRKGNTDWETVEAEAAAERGPG